ncbi:MAG: arsenate reductase family protein [Clostridiaceae bacterium]
MNIQIFGTKKCFDTKKAERYFKERKIKYQFIDLNEKAISKGELKSILTTLSVNDLIDSKSKEFTKLSIDHIRSSSVKEEILLKNPKLYKTPIVRNGKLATVGYEIETWKQWE